MERRDKSCLCLSFEGSPVPSCLFLQSRGFLVTVNCVAWPEQLYLIPAWAEMFHSHGLRFHA